jgi:hypothetical protein
MVRLAVVFEAATASRQVRRNRSPNAKFHAAIRPSCDGSVVRADGGANHTQRCTMRPPTKKLPCSASVIDLSCGESAKPVTIRPGNTENAAMVMHPKRSKPITLPFRGRSRLTERFTAQGRVLQLRRASGVRLSRDGGRQHRRYRAATP